MKYKVGDVLLSSFGQRRVTAIVLRAYTKNGRPAYDGYSRTDCDEWSWEDGIDREQEWVPHPDADRIWAAHCVEVLTNG